MLVAALVLAAFFVGLVAGTRLQTAFGRAQIRYAVILDDQEKP